MFSPIEKTGVEPGTGGADPTTDKQGAVPNSRRVDIAGRMKARSHEMVDRRKGMHCRGCNTDKKCVSSRYVDNRFVQDRSKPMVCVGSDAVFLYPSMLKDEVGDEAYQ